MPKGVEYFNHADESVWPTERLKRRLKDVQDTQKVPHSPERMAQIEHELACIAFELLQREQTHIREQEDLAWLERDLIEDCPTEPIDTEAINKLLAEGGDETEDPPIR